MPANPPQVLRLQDYVPYQLSVASHAVSKNLALLCQKQFDLTVPQWSILAALAEESPLTQQVLCNRAALDKMTVMRGVQKLVRKLLVKRFANQEDRRSNRLLLTPAGLKMHRKMLPLVLEFEVQVTMGIAAEDVLRLKRMLREIGDQALVSRGTP